ncbi:sigma-70 family RNA polymerase sigma factor [Chitinophaga sp.]|uniref:RNA polymerase sigma factor n=1 Tax=Chitinophaga sp. TaxID=1869181 RepID=UPI0031DEF6AD
MINLRTDNIPSDEERLLRIAEGDEKAFYSFYKEFAPRLRAYVWKSTRSDADTEEILQATFMRIWLSRDKIPAINNIQAWMYTITANTCLQHFRKQRNDRKKLEQLALSGKRDHDVSTPIDLVQLEEIKRAIGTALQKMSPRRKLIYRMNREEGKKPAEIAQVLSIPVGTVKNHLSASNKEIRELLIAAGYRAFILICVLLNFY